MKAPEQLTMPPAHMRAWELLPWYLNGSLDEVERENVRLHLGECLVCTRELRRLEQLDAAVAAPITDHACAQAFARLSRQIYTTDLLPSWPQRAFKVLREIFEPVPLIAGASLLVVCSVLVGTIVASGRGEVRQAEQPFQTLGRRQSLPSELSHPLVRIVLRDDVGTSGLDAWLERHSAELVDGPSAIGVLTVRVAMGARTIDALLASLRADTQTLFIEPVDRVGTRPDRHR
jgi:anti-sigma factor RsiW